MKFVLLQMPSNVVSQQEYILSSVPHGERSAIRAGMVGELQGQYPVGYDASGYILRY